MIVVYMGLISFPPTRCT